MTDRDFDAFGQEFRRLSSALERYRRTPVELDAQADAYFHVLKKFPLALVIQKADTWLATETHMPKPAEWVSVIVHQAAKEIPQLSASEAAEWLRAETLKWEGDSCSCEACRDADVTHRLLRFVPEFTTEDTDRHVRIGERVVTAGHWAHGWELFRYYAAKDRFWTEMYQKFGDLETARKKLPVLSRLEVLTGKAEDIIARKQEAVLVAEESHE